MKKSYLITGGCGFIGCNFVHSLLQEGNRVIVLDNLSRPNVTENLKWLQANWKDQLVFKYADLRSDKEITKECVEEVDVVYHLAGQVAVTFSVADPVNDFFSNAVATLNLLECIRNSKNKPTLIYSSTNKVYGKMDDLEILEKTDKYQYKDLPQGVAENYPLNFYSPYGCSKGAADQYILDYARIYGLKTVVFRQSCIYGTRQFGIEDQGWLAWFTIAAVLGRPITIFGNGKQVRDVLFIDDLYQAFRQAEKNINTISGQAFNIGGGSQNVLSLLELIKFLEEKMGKTITCRYEDSRPGDQKVYVSNIGKAHALLNWAPQVSKTQGIEKIYQWIIENKNLFNTAV